ncbi:hypothetical protein ILP92_14165 [Maribius pontilimi]|uniref:Excalibur calcium-binding domain-containing protein n=1 Tax=Palleronia pontilimi TaxID=1964209 RepID=A0A934MI40_9RHOB|nr:hypothetical protein [Palleronia pontilimi]MBJ3763894.1 hypothetical protein [Palleronia pontilimi]
MWKYACLGMLAVAACTPALPESGATLDGRPANIGQGVGFGSYQGYEAARIARERELQGGSTSQPIVPTRPVISSEELSAAGLPSGGNGSGGLPPVDTVGAGAPLDARGPVATQSSPATPVSVNNPGISDEQSFEAVSSRESIESDAERLERQAQAYRVIQPTAVPTRSGASGPNIVQYALSTTNARGQSIYRRSGISLQSRSVRACQRYPSPDLAQEAFLERGGPEKDSLNLDPDGDGFACSWDPAPFRAARG